MNEEQSFAIKFARQRKEGEKFVFDPSALMWRRTNVSGGLARRTGDDWYIRELEARVFYYRHVVGYYFTWRYRLFLPCFGYVASSRFWCGFGMPTTGTERWVSVSLRAPRCF